MFMDVFGQPAVKANLFLLYLIMTYYRLCKEELNFLVKHIYSTNFLLNCQSGVAFISNNLDITSDIVIWSTITKLSVMLWNKTKGRIGNGAFARKKYFYWFEIYHYLMVHQQIS